MATLEVRNELFNHWVDPNQTIITEQMYDNSIQEPVYIKQCSG